MTTNNPKNVTQRRPFSGPPSDPTNIIAQLQYIHKTINDSRFLAPTDVLANYTVTTYDRIIRLKNAGLTITLPVLKTGEDGFTIQIVDISGKANASPHTIKLIAGSKGLINGTATATINTNFGSFNLHGQLSTQNWYSI